MDTIKGLLANLIVLDFPAHARQTFFILYHWRFDTERSQRIFNLGDFATKKRILRDQIVQEDRFRLGVNNLIVTISMGFRIIRYKGFFDIYALIYLRLAKPRYVKSASTFKQMALSTHVSAKPIVFRGLKWNSQNLKIVKDFDDYKVPIGFDYGKFFKSLLNSTKKS